jgi:hypothetical protein
MSLEASRPSRPRIEIPGDVLVADDDFDHEVFGRNVDPRTKRRMEAKGFPFTIIAGCKFRPLNEGRRWLAARIVRKGQAPTRRRRSR